MAGAPLLCRDAAGQIRLSESLMRLALTARPIDQWPAIVALRIDLAERRQIKAALACRPGKLIKIGRTGDVRLKNSAASGLAAAPSDAARRSPLAAYILMNSTAPEGQTQPKFSWRPLLLIGRQ